jgi:hypothetical protein
MLWGVMQRAYYDATGELHKTATEEFVEAFAGGGLVIHWQCIDDILRVSQGMLCQSIRRKGFASDAIVGSLQPAHSQH